MKLNRVYLFHNCLLFVHNFAKNTSNKVHKMIRAVFYIQKLIEGEIFAKKGLRLKKIHISIFSGNLGANFKCV